MKIVKMACAGSLVALAGAGGLRYFAPAVPRFVVKLLVYRPGRDPPIIGFLSDCTGQIDWSAVSAVAFAAGLIIAVGGFARAGWSLGVSVLGRRLLYLAAAVAVAAAGPMLYATWHFYSVLRFLISGNPITQQLHQSLSHSTGPFNLGLALLPVMPGLLLAAGIAGASQQPRAATSGRVMAMIVVLTVVIGVVFAAGFVLNGLP